MQMSCLMVKIPLKQLSEITKRVDHILINIYIKKPRGIIVIDFTTTAAIFQRSKVMNLPKKLVEHSAKQKHQGYPLWRLSKKTLLNRPLKLQPPLLPAQRVFFLKQAMVSNEGRFVRGAMPHAHLKTPTQWPKDTKVDPGKWVYWLPEGWMQGIRTQSLSGKDLKCYLSLILEVFWKYLAVFFPFCG